MAEWLVKYDGVCARCGIPLMKGTPAVWDRTTRTIRCIECPTQPPSPPRSNDAIEVAPGVAGRSARARYEHLAAKRDERITQRWGTGNVAKVVRALSSEPQSTRAWKAGAAGEEKLAAELDGVPGLRMLHDRRIPGSRANIDHIVIGPAGVFVVDAKNYHGLIKIRDRGGFFRADLRLTIDGRDQSKLADSVLWQADVVVSTLQDAGIDGSVVVTPVLCFLNVEWPLLSPPSKFRGVRLESHRSIKRLVTRSSTLSGATARSLGGDPCCWSSGDAAEPRLSAHAESARVTIPHAT